jgi:hypothetical protein
LIDDIAEFYPYVQNQIKDLEFLIVESVPPSSKTSANAGIVDGEELLEQFANIQVFLYPFFVQHRTKLICTVF